LEPKNFIKGRGAQEKIHNRFSSNRYEIRDDFLNYLEKEGEPIHQYKTTIIETFPKSIVNTITSPDIPTDVYIVMLEILMNIGDTELG